MLDRLGDRAGRSGTGRDTLVTDAWWASLQHLGKPDAVIETLERGFRVPASVIDHAAQLLPSVAPGLGAPVAVRDNPGRLDVVRVEGSLLYERVAGSVAETLRGPGPVGVIVVEPAAIAAAEPDRRTRLRRLDVVLTRAVSELTVLHSLELPAELAADEQTG